MIFLRLISNIGSVVNSSSYEEAIIIATHRWNSSFVLVLSDPRGWTTLLHTVFCLKMQAGEKRDEKMTTHIVSNGQWNPD